MTATDSSIATARHAARAAAEKLAEDIIAMDVSERLALADIFLIASAPSERQVNAIVDGIEDELSKFELKPIRREGRSGGRWVLLDYGDIVIHVQHEEDRVFYALERLWKDCPVVDLQLGDDASAKAAASSDSSRRRGAKAEYARFGIFRRAVRGCSSCFGEIRTTSRSRSAADGVGRRNGAVAQLVAHWWMQGVRGSSPLSSTGSSTGIKGPADFLCGDVSVDLATNPGLGLAANLLRTVRRQPVLRADSRGHVPTHRQIRADRHSHRPDLPRVGSPPGTWATRPGALGLPVFATGGTLTRTLHGPGPSGRNSGQRRPGRRRRGPEPGRSRPVETSTRGHADSREPEM